MHIPSILYYFPFSFGLLFLFTELYLNAALRNRKNTKTRADKNSLTVLWVVIIAAMVLGGVCSGIPATRLSEGQPYVYYSGIFIALAGYVLRLVAIYQLGKRFTVDVQISEDHQLKQDGLYSIIRHPSYTGVLLAFTGLAITYSNWLSLVIIVVPICIVFGYRIRIEEAALEQEFGDAYRSYMRKTKRLIPFIY